MGLDVFQVNETVLVVVGESVPGFLGDHLGRRRAGSRTQGVPRAEQAVELAYTQPGFFGFDSFD